jgi:Zn-dependent protease
MINISNQEATEILISVIAISLALSLNTMGFGEVFSDIPYFVQLASFFLIVVGTGFVLHELAHKFTAIYFGHLAQFRMWTQGLMFMGVLAVLPTRFMFIAPGAVYIRGWGRQITRAENGIISAAGPATNLVIALCAIIAYVLVGPLVMEVGGAGAQVELLSSLAWINVFLGLFNMIPIFPLDGSKILAWSPVVYVLLGGVLAVLFFTV